MTAEGPFPRVRPFVFGDVPRDAAGVRVEAPLVLVVSSDRLVSWRVRLLSLVKEANLAFYAVHVFPSVVRACLGKVC